MWDGVIRGNVTSYGFSTSELLLPLNSGVWSRHCCEVDELEDCLEGVGQFGCTGLDVSTTDNEVSLPPDSSMHVMRQIATWKRIFKKRNKKKAKNKQIRA
ncbi:hypothetical protein Tco_1488341, partial [Tanacetum coccineum]